MRFCQIQIKINYKQSSKGNSSLKRFSKHVIFTVGSNFFPSSTIFIDKLGYKWQEMLNYRFISSKLDTISTKISLNWSLISQRFLIAINFDFDWPQFVRVIQYSWKGRRSFRFKAKAEAIIGSKHMFLLLFRIQVLREVWTICIITSSIVVVVP